eukprot:gene7311-14905_t
MTAKYSAVLDESTHNPLDDDDDTVEVILHDDNDDEDDGLKAAVPVEKTKFKTMYAIDGIFYTWNVLTFAWIKPLLELGNKRPLEFTDLYNLDFTDSAKGVYLKFRSIWKVQMKTKKQSLIYTYMSAFGGPFIAAGALKLIHDCCLFVGPMLLKAIIGFLNDPTQPKEAGLIYVAELFLANLAMSLCLRQYFFWCFRVGMRLRSTVITSVFQKALKLSSGALDKRSTGQITNLMSLDSQRLQELTPYLHAVWYSFFQVGVALYFLWGLVGPSCLGGVAVIVSCIPITGKISAYLKTIQKELSGIRDDRVKITSEVLGGIKVIKLQAWEEEFQKRLNEVRDKEMELYRRYMIMQSISGTFASSIPLLVAIATFFAFIATGGVLDVATALTALALFEVLRFPLFMFPTVMNSLIEAKVALDRIKGFLLDPEKEPVPPRHLRAPGVMLKRATLVWDSGKRAVKDAGVVLVVSEGLCRSLLSRMRACLRLRPLGGGDVTTATESDSDSVRKEALLTDEEYELLLCKTQLADAVDWIDVLESRIDTLQKAERRSQSSSSLLEETYEEDLGDEDDDGGGGAITLEDITDTSTGTGSGRNSTGTTRNVSDSKAADRLLTLVRVSFRAKCGDLVAIVGQVGSGKSSIFSSLLGDVRIVDGSMAIRGSIAYVGQRPFIQNCSVKDNILFGADYDAERYNWALSVCALAQDLNMLPAGDETEIGERGINLSGGQKARVALARAVYSNAEVYLLDDPLSAVDAHVGQHLFENCILSLQAQGKCVIMSTNALNFLRSASFILVMKEGKAIQHGTFGTLVQEPGVFFDMMATFDEGRSSSTKSQLSQSSSKEPNRTTATTGTAVPTVMTGKSIPVAGAAKNASGKDSSASQGSSSSSSSSPQTGTLITTEDRESGSVDRAVYMSWARAAGGMISTALLVSSFALGEGLLLLSSWWLSYWSQNRNNASPWYFLGIYAVLNVLVCLSLFARELYCRLCCWRAGNVLFKEVLHAVLFSPLSFFDTTPLGRITNRLSKDIYTVDEQLPQTIRWYVACMLKVFSSLMYSCVVTPMFTIGLVPIVGFYYTAQRFYIKTSRELSRLDSASRSPIYALFAETLDGLSTIRAFRTENILITRINNLLDTNQKAFFLSFSANCWLAVRLELAGTFIVTFAALFAVLGREESPSSPEADARRQAFSGIAGLALSFALTVTQSLNWSVRMASDLESQMVAVERIKNYSGLLQEAAHENEGDPSSQSWPSGGAVRFEDVALRYRAGMPRVLDGVSFVVHPKEKIGIVGRTGAGKSSLVVALLRLVELDGGSITIDNIRTSDLGLRTLRAAIAVIPQDPVLFSGTLRSNVDPFRQHTDGAIWETLRRVQLGESFSTLEATIGEGASNLSVGQRQLVCIARALLSKCKVIVMDEATAAVDVETDALIQRAIRQEFSESTCLTVAHRLNTIMDSDRVLVMDKGTVKEFDTPANLLADEHSEFSSLVANWESAGQTHLPYPHKPVLRSQPSNLRLPTSTITHIPPQPNNQRPKCDAKESSPKYDGG